MSTGEILAEKGTEVDKQLATDIQNAAIPYVWIQGERKNHKVLSNMMVDLASYVDFDPEEVGVTELVYYPVLEGILAEAGSDEELKEVIKRDIHDRSIRLEISRFISIFSLIFVELMSSRCSGSSSSYTFPVMDSIIFLLNRLSDLTSPTRRKAIWFIEWMEFSHGSFL